MVSQTLDVLMVMYPLEGPEFLQAVLAHFLNAIVQQKVRC